jgi:hypothetical protein
MMKKIMILLLLTASQQVKAQQDPVELLVKLNTYLEKTPNLNFNLIYYYEEDDTSGVTRDTMSGVSRNNLGRTWMQIDGMKKINNEYYFVLMDTVNKELFISNPQPLTKQYTNSDLTDTTFLSYYVQSISARDSSIFTIVDFVFKETAPYYHYQLIYKNTTLEPVSISYSMKKDDPNTNGAPLPGPGGAAQYGIRLKVVFSNFNSNAVSDSLFTTKQYFIRQNGVFVLQPGYTDYQLVDLTGN